MDGTPTMRSDDVALERSSGPCLLDAVAAGLGALLAAALFSGLFDGGLPPKPARAEAAAPAVLPAGGAPARPSSPRLCFHGPGGEFLDFAPAGQHCPQ
jgi:hypothetical protein